MRDLAREVLAGEEAWVVGGAVRDELLGRPVLDLDIATREPERAARAYAKHGSGAPFPLSERHGAWRVALEDGRTVDFTPLAHGIDADLLSRDFTINAIAVPLEGGEPYDPCGGREDLELRSLRAVTDSVFEDDPLRLLRAVRLADELGFHVAPLTEELVRRHAPLVDRASGERVLAELNRLSARGYRRLEEFGLIEALGGGAIDERLERVDSPDYRLVAVFGAGVERWPISNETKRYARVLLRAKAPADRSMRAIHRYRLRTEPWALDALAFLGAEELAPLVEEARANDAEPLLRGDELGLPPGPDVGRLLAEIEEERAVGTITTREEALELARRRTREIRQDG
jgi:Poly A polymerase head domain/Probable RNA and SrmB- binding site of polymerase A